MKDWRTLCIVSFSAALLGHHWLEGSMLRHMLVQLPLLVLSGVLYAVGVGGQFRAVGRWYANIDQYGVTGLTAGLLVSAYWMIPRMLEKSLTDPLTEAAKFVSLVMLGMALPASLRRASWITQLFYLGNFSWMTAIVGIQYQTLPQRLCNAYVLDDQVDTGMAIVGAAVLVAVLWCWRLAPAILRRE
ncbi:hypothetical protein GJ698_15230 [Pseudoduganella sp. FT26W]|uniref:DUF1404 domain-containing protein n=1 Tax=Duganella aquatilis TaxID=2666082 RepID=A0A844CXB3_9BURK|nr:hypothetical protein [Duganella aquatilis]MRW85437.1 hypothetical protein [Duganella aquatilis]